MEKDKYSYNYLKSIFSLYLLIFLLAACDDASGSKCSAENPPSIDNKVSLFDMPVVVDENGDMLGSAILLNDHHIATVGHVIDIIGDCGYVVLENNGDTFLLDTDNMSLVDQGIDSIVFVPFWGSTEINGEIINTEPIKYGDRLSVNVSDSQVSWGTVITSRATEDIPGIVRTVKIDEGNQICRGHSGDAVYNQRGEVVGLLYGARAIPPTNPFGSCFEGGYAVFMRLP